MQDPDTGNWIVFNGEIYNFRELRKELEAARVEFKSHSDTEVILAAYRVWGESCLTRLGGMFAFALWDALRKRLLLARDPMGIKPLYYHQSERTFIFASEIRTLLRTGLGPRKADPTGILSYLSFGSVDETWAIREADFNDGQDSREIERPFATEHLEIPVSQQDTLAALPEALFAMDQQSIDGINTYLVSAKTRAAGVKVALTGLGADEMFAGYPNFRRVPKMELLSKRFGRLPRLARRPLAASVALFAGQDDRSRKLAQLSPGHGSIVHPYFLVRALFGAAERGALFGARLEDSERALESVLRESVAQPSTLDPANTVSYLAAHCSIL